MITLHAMFFLLLACCMQEETSRRPSADSTRAVLESVLFFAHDPGENFH